MKRADHVIARYAERHAGLRCEGSGGGASCGRASVSRETTLRTWPGRCHTGTPPNAGNHDHFLPPGVFACFWRIIFGQPNHHRCIRTVRTACSARRARGTSGRICPSDQSPLSADEGVIQCPRIMRSYARRRRFRCPQRGTCRFRHAPSDTSLQKAGDAVFPGTSQNLRHSATHSPSVTPSVFHVKPAMNQL